MIQVKWRVRQLAEAKGMNIFHLAEQADIAYNTASGLWHGRALRIDRDTLARICQALECRPGDVLELVDNSVESTEETTGNRTASLPLAMVC